MKRNFYDDEWNSMHADRRPTNQDIFKANHISQEYDDYYSSPIQRGSFQARGNNRGAFGMRRGKAGMNRGMETNASRSRGLYRGRGQPSGRGFRGNGDMIRGRGKPNRGIGFAGERGRPGERGQSGRRRPFRGAEQPTVRQAWNARPQSVVMGQNMLRPSRSRGYIRGQDRRQIGRRRGIWSERGGAGPLRSFASEHNNSLRGNFRGRGDGRGNSAPAAKKRRIEVSPSRWEDTYDRPLPKEILDKCKIDVCEVCSIECNGPVIAKSHYDGKAHEKRVGILLQELIADADDIPVKKVKIDSDNTKSDDASNNEKDARTLEWCEICRSSVASSQYQVHINGAQHQKRERIFKLRTPDSQLSLCAVCNVQMNMNQISDHMNGKLHRKKLQSKLAPDVFCSECNLQLAGWSAYKNHLIGRRHRETMRKKDPWRYCKTCNMDFNSEEESTVHSLSEQHKLVAEQQGDVVTVIDYNSMTETEKNVTD